MKLLFLIFLTITLQAKLINYDIKPKYLKTNKFMNIKILDSMELRFDDFNDIELSELSALAYKKPNLYALSDRGYLYTFKLKLKKNKVSRLTLKKAVVLKKKNNKRLKKSHRDAEGMVLVENELYISFERKPRVDVFSLNAKMLRKYKISKDLRYIQNYQTKNKALESIAYSKKYGILTAPEQPLIGSDEGLHVVYAKDKVFKFFASSSLSAIEFIDEDRLLTLERSFNALTRQRVVILKEINLSKIKNGVCQSRVLAMLNSSKGWRLDNFEGLVKVGKNKFLMVSDDNGGFFQKTLLVLFEILN
jgi:hypothetical protein